MTNPGTNQVPATLTYHLPDALGSVRQLAGSCGSVQLALLEAYNLGRIAESKAKRLAGKLGYERKNHHDL